jgi:hypothetical protein
MNTKNPISLLLGLALICVLFLGACSSTETNSPASGPVELPAVPAEQVVQEFYDWYSTYPGNPIVSGAYQEHPAVGESLVKTIEEARKDGLMADPIICAQDIPDSFTVWEAVVDGSTARVHVLSSWAGHELDVELQPSGGEWVINRVICSVP